jgi:hypothetical protein
MASKKANWPPSPVKRGKMRLEKNPLLMPRELYNELQQVGPCSKEDRHEVHRIRAPAFPYFDEVEHAKDSNLLQHSLLPDGKLERRKPPVQMGAPHRILPQITSAELKAAYEEDFRTNLSQTLEASFIPPLATSKDVRKVYNHRRNKQMDEMLTRLKLKADKAKRVREASRDIWTLFEDEDNSGAPLAFFPSCSTPEMGQMLTMGSQPSIREEEDEEQRISREFREYELESMCASMPQTPASSKASHLAGLSADKYAEGFEDDMGATLLLDQLQSSDDGATCPRAQFSTLRLDTPEQTYEAKDDLGTSFRSISEQEAVLEQALVP